jgi:uncharacterized protein YtpQ (UPF0354 family)
MFKWLGAKKAAVEESGSKDNLVPRIKVPAFLAALQQMNIPADQLPVTEPFVGELLIAYSFDLPHGFQMVSGADLGRLGLQKSELRAIAVANLKKQMPRIQFGEIEQSDKLKAIVTGNNLEACALLLTEFWADLGKKVTGDPVVAAPHRDFLGFTTTASQEGVNILRSLAKEIAGAEDNHALSPQLMIWRTSHWELFN